MEIADQVKARRLRIIYPVILLVSGIFFFIPFLGKVHLFDWDEINFAESAREMIVTGNYHLVQINFEPFSEKPPLFFWLQALAMKSFGINEFAARFPNAIFGVITLLSFYFIGKKHRSSRFGFIWALSYLGTFLPHLYFKSAIIDPVFNYFIFMGIYFMYLLLTAQKYRYWFLVLSAVFIGLGTLTKGPVALLVFLLTFLVYFLFTRFRDFPSVKYILIYIVAYSLVCLLWFGPEIAENGLWFIKEFLEVQAELFLTPVASHGQPFYYHFVVVFIGCFPISILALTVLFGKSISIQKELLLVMKILFWTVMILFSLSTTKIVHYSSLTYFPLSFIAAVFLTDLLEKKRQIRPWMLWLLFFMGLIFASLLSALPWVANHPSLITPYLNDPYAVASLNVPVGWMGYEGFIGVAWFVAIIVALLLFKRQKNQPAILVLFYSTAFCLFFYLVAVVPKIEKYSQGPAVEFYESLQGKDVYVWPVGFRSYAQYFYGKKMPKPAYGEKDLDFLLTGDIDRPAYFVIKVTKKNFEEKCKDCELIEQKGGFKFYRREPVK